MEIVLNFGFLYQTL